MKRTDGSRVAVVNATLRSVVEVVRPRAGVLRSEEPRCVTVRAGQDEVSYCVSYGPPRRKGARQEVRSQ